MTQRPPVFEGSRFLGELLGKLAEKQPTSQEFLVTSSHRGGTLIAGLSYEPSAGFGDGAQSWAVGHLCYHKTTHGV